MSLDSLAKSELERRARRNVRDRLARSYLKDHPELIDNPDSAMSSPVPEGTTEAAIRSIARHYHNMRKVRQLLRSGDGLATS